MPQIIGLSFSLWPIIIGRATFCVVVVYNNVIALRRTSTSLVEASQDLGADGFQRASCPSISPSASRRRAADWPAPAAPSSHKPPANSQADRLPPAAQPAEPTDQAERACASTRCRGGFVSHRVPTRSIVQPCSWTML
jgi:hypothetical protein